MLEKIAGMLGASPTQYRYLLDTEKLVEKRVASESWIPLLCSGFVVIVFVGVLFLACLLNIRVYFGVYCIMVVGGFIGFVYYFK